MKYKKMVSDFFQDKCPITGKSVKDKAVTFFLHGKELRVCCHHCQRKIMHLFHYIMDSNPNFTLLSFQDKCPITGKSVKEKGVTFSFNHKKLRVCSSQCQQKIIRLFHYLFQ